VVISHLLSAPSICYDPWHPSSSIYVPDSLFHRNQIFFGRPLGLAPSASYSIHFFTQSLSSFHSTCPNHHNLLCCSTEIMSSNPSLSLNPLLGTLSATHPSNHSHLCQLKCQHIILSYRPGLTSMQHSTFLHNCCTISLSLSMIYPYR